MRRNLEPVDLEQLRSARWFGGKNDTLVRADRVRTLFAAEGGSVELVALTAGDGSRTEYALPLRDGHECDGDDPLWPALARAAGFETPAAHGFLAYDLSNTVVVLDGGALLKLYRRPARGPHPEPVALRALAASDHAPNLLGELHEDGRTLLVVQEFVAGEPVGWEALIARLASGDDAGADPGELAVATARVHRTLADVLGVTEAAVELTPKPLERELEQLTTGVARALNGIHKAPAQRIHGDLHVGQFIRAQTRLVIVDWEGEPHRPLAERISPQPTLRDLASLRLSLAHAAAAAHRRNPNFDWQAWSTTAMTDALAAYESHAGPVDRRLLHALEVAKELEELEYATRYLPEWLYAPTAVLPFVLEEGQ